MRRSKPIGGALQMKTMTDFLFAYRDANLTCSPVSENMGISATATKSPRREVGNFALIRPRRLSCRGLKLSFDLTTSNRPFRSHVFSTKDAFCVVFCH